MVKSWSAVEKNWRRVQVQVSKMLVQPIVTFSTDEYQIRRRCVALHTCSFNDFQEKSVQAGFRSSLLLRREVIREELVEMIDNDYYPWFGVRFFIFVSREAGSSVEKLGMPLNRM